MAARRYGLYVLGLASLVNLLNYGNRNILVPMYGDLRAVFDFSNAEIGLLASAFMFPHALLTLFFGWAGDRFDKRRVLAWGLIVWSGAAVASAAAFDFTSMMISRGIVGIGTAACVPVGVALLCQVYPPEAKARTISIFNLGIFLGSGIGIGVGAMLGYPYGVLAMALPGFALAIMMSRLHVPENASKPEPSGPDWRAFVTQALRLFAIPTMRWVLVAAVLMGFAAGSYTAWFFDMVAVDKGMGTESAFVLFGVALIGGLLGILTGGVVGDRLQERRVYGRLAAISIGMACSVPFTLIFLYSPDGVLLYVSSWLCMFFMTWYHGPMAAVVDDLSSDDQAATAQAIVIFAIHFLGTTPSAWVVGELADRFSLRDAMLLPTAAIAVASVALLGGWRTIMADRQAVVARAGMR